MTSVSSFLENLSLRKVILIFYCLGIIIYANALFNDFVGDDFGQVKDNLLVHSVFSIPSLFSQNSFNSETAVSNGSFYRPLLSTTFSIVYLFFFGSPFGFHLIQILIHITNAVLIFLVFHKFFRRGISFLLSLIFLTHPFNTEAVVYISNLQEPLFLFFGILALYLSMNESKSRFSSALIITFLTMSLLSKETGIIFLLLIPIFSALNKKRAFFKNLVQITTAFLIYAFLRFIVAQIFFSKHAIVPIMTFPFWERVIHIPKIILFYLKTFFYPKDLLIFQSWTIESLNLADFFIPLIIDVFFFLIISILSFFIYRKSKDLFKGLLFFFVWFALGLGIHLQIIPLDQTVADRWFYSPMVGLLGVIGIIIKFLKLEKLPALGIIVVILITIIFSLRVIVRNTNWKDQLTLFEHDIKYNQDSYQLEMGLGFSYDFQGSSQRNPAEAEKHYVRAVKLFPGTRTISSLGVFYLYANRYEDAKRELESSLNYDPDNSTVLTYLAVSKYKLGDKEGALNTAKRAYSISQSKSVLSIVKAIENGQELNLKN